MDTPEDDGDTVYVRRDERGAIVSVSRVALPGHDERRSRQHPDVAAFVHTLDPAAPSLAASDLALIRVIEDLVDVLIEKEVLRLTDLPESAQAKLLSRQRMRHSLRSLSLLGGDDETL
ncbi:hypothetical protein AAG565_14595 [Fontimonas sp. SYSU GA230001]|uniref:hypothetical protein n=1 Tax=Fontimonas sp. SYSU GA230001 TaxID=3142450 RepID=UPI0032B4649F